MLHNRLKHGLAERSNFGCRDQHAEMHWTLKTLDTNKLPHQCNNLKHALTNETSVLSIPQGESCCINGCLKLAIVQINDTCAYMCQLSMHVRVRVERILDNTWGRCERRSLLKAQTNAKSLFYWNCYLMFFWHWEDSQHLCRLFNLLKPLYHWNLPTIPQANLQLHATATTDAT